MTSSNNADTRIMLAASQLWSKKVGELAVLKKVAEDASKSVELAFQSNP